MNNDLNQNMLPQSPLPTDQSSQPSLISQSDASINEVTLNQPLPLDQSSQSAQPQNYVNDATFDQAPNSSTVSQVGEVNDSLNNVPAGYVPGAEAFPSYATAPVESSSNLIVEQTPEFSQETPLVETAPEFLQEMPAVETSSIETMSLPQNNIETTAETDLENSLEASMETSVENSVENSAETFVSLSQQAATHDAVVTPMPQVNNDLHVVDKTQEQPIKQDLGHPVPNDADTITMQADKDEAQFLQELNEHLKTAHADK